ncbi:hypothetical protein [Planctomicrobium sp. SH527]|uniref:hypothetical protein n=1 Tax=Planctomicrobium sp. SH527 TaxID=3448123 RepID=UPI003F5C84CF
MRELSIALLCFGGLLHLGLLIPTFSGELSWFLLAFLCWILFPYVLAGYAAGKTRPKLIFQAVSLVICLLVAFIGTALTYKILYLDRPDAQSAIGLLLMPFYQLLVLAPLIEIGMIFKVFYPE